MNVEADDVTKSSCNLTWEEPEYDGGSPVTGYYVEKLSGARWLKVNKKPIKARDIAIDDLIDGSDYEFRVLAENDAGISKPSETTGRFKAKDPYEAPAKPEAPVVDKITPEEASLSWSAPNDGGSPITSYIIESKKKGDIKWAVANKKEKVTDTKFTVTGLKEETEYEFRVSAENKAGQSPPSAPTSAKYGKQRRREILFHYRRESLEYWLQL